MSLLPASSIGDESTGFYNGVATQSLRTTRGDQSYLYYTPSAGDRFTGTFNYWVKIEDASNTALARYIFNAYGAQNEANFSFLHHSSTAAMAFGGYGVNYFYTTALLRDEANWYNMMWTWDTSNGTQNKRQRAYINGVEITSMGSGSRSGLNQSTGFGGNHQHTFLANNYPPAGTANDSWIGGYHAYTTYVNGLALDPTAFGEFKNGVWIPKNYETKPSLIAQNTGTAIGDMTEQSGLAGAFDTNRFESYADAAVAFSVGTTAGAYIGKNWGSSKTVTGFALYSPTQYGFVGSGGSSFTVRLYGSNSNPSNSTDGTLLYTSSSVNDNLVSTNGARGAIKYFADTTITSEETVSNFTTDTAYSYHWVVLTPNTTESIHVSEVEFYEDGNTYYGTGGFRLDYNASDLNTSGSSRTDPYGSSTDQPNNSIADASGSGNHLTKTTNIASTDFTLDSPENNFATLLPSRSGENRSSQTFSEGNLQWTSSTYNYNSTGSSINVPTSGKWYFEVYVKTHGTGESHDFGPGLQGVKSDSMSKTDPATATYGDSTHYITRRDFASRIEKNLSNVYIGNNPGTGTPDESDSVVNYNQGKIVQLAFDADSGKVYWGLDNTYWDDDVSTDGNPSSGTNETTSLTTGVEYFFTLQQYSNSYVSVTNFGQDSSFAGNKTSGSANGTDANGKGDFYYDPPTGYLALCSSNLPDTTISPSKSSQATDYFNTITYTGDGASSRALTGVGFQPDWIWYKHRSIAYGHSIYDSSRGTGENHLRIDTPITEGAYNDLYGTLTSFDADGITVAKGDDSSAPDAFFNTSGQTIVGWNWKANGGTTSSDTNGTITSTVQASTEAGFSIVTYTGNNGSSGTIGHGLSSAPEVILLFGRTVSNSNMMGATSQGWTKYAAFGNSGGYFVSDSTIWNDTAPTTTVFSVGSAANVNDNYNYVAYCFHSVAGYSAIGNTYNGNGSTDGTFVYTGFRPAWIMTKKIGGSGNWYINDTVRSPANPTSSFGANLYADLANAESGNGMDILSNGFKILNTDASQNASGVAYIYMAFAEQPFKFSNAR